MAPEVVTIEGNAALASFWPSIASASAQLSRRRRSAGRVLSTNPAVLGLASPGFVGNRGPDRSPAPRKGLW